MPYARLSEQTTRPHRIKLHDFTGVKRFWRYIFSNVDDIETEDGLFTVVGDCLYDNKVVRVDRNSVRSPTTLAKTVVHETIHATLGPRFPEKTVLRLEANIMRALSHYVEFKEKQ